MIIVGGKVKNSPFSMMNQMLESRGAKYF